jgi:hypothetical protein
MSHPTIITLITSLGAERPAVLKTLFASDFRHINKCLLQLYRAYVSATGVDYGVHTTTNYIVRFNSDDTTTRFHFVLDESLIVNIYEPIKETNIMKPLLDTLSHYLSGLVDELAYRIEEKEPYHHLVAGALTDKVAHEYINDLLTVRRVGDRCVLLEYSLDEPDYYARYSFVRREQDPEDWLITDCVLSRVRLKHSEDVFWDHQSLHEPEPEVEKDF